MELSIHLLSGSPLTWGEFYIKTMRNTLSCWLKPANTNSYSIRLISVCLFLLLLILLYWNVWGSNFGTRCQLLEADLFEGEGVQ